MLFHDSSQPLRAPLSRLLCFPLLLICSAVSAFAQETPASKPDPAATDAEVKTTSVEDKQASDAAANETARKEAADRAARTAARARGEITFDDLKFDIEKDGVFERGMLTQQIEELNKKNVRLRGYILPASVFQQTGIKKFVLVRDNQECCFGPGAAIYDCVMVEMTDGKGANFTTRAVSVKGKFTIETELYKYPDGKQYAIYKILATEVK